MDLPGSTPFHPVPVRLAPYACHPGESRGRRVREPDSPTRNGHQRDRDRIVHSVAFRRLKHKTQVFIAHEADHYRTRLTHSLEVAQIARSMARVLGLNEDLAEALALAHDMGHPPFGHAGEEALAAEMAPHGGFDHNEQTFRILTTLEHRYADFDGLNLTWETLEGIVKHNGPLEGAVPPSIAAYCREFDLELDSQPGAEAQVAALADDIAYNNHDIDDGLRAGLFTVEQLAPLPLVGPVFDEVAARYPGLDPSRLIHEAVRRMIDLMVTDLLAETNRRLSEAAPESAAALRELAAPVVAFSEQMGQNDRALRDFLFQHMYRHERITRMTAAARKVVRGLFVNYMERPELLPEAWRPGAADSGGAARARLVADYIAGMTDRFAQEEHGKLLGRDGKN
ncbi:MAG: deoxyguanosinetriphosphate triphosphohydrolase [Alphaproteobacteria bacterium]